MTTKVPFDVMLNKLNQDDFIKPIRGLEQYGRSLNPRAVLGFKDTYIENVADYSDQYTVASFKENYGIDLTDLTLSEAKQEITKTLKIEGFGTSPENVYNDATKRATKLFNEMASGQYENKTAVLWDRINPNYTYTVAVKLDRPKTDPKTLYMIISN